MKLILKTLILAASISLASAQVYTTPVGYNVVSCLGGSDTHVSVPFHQKPLFQGGASVAGSAVTLDSAITSTLGTNTAGEGTHYLRVVSGTDAGKYFNITAGSGTSLTLDLNGDTLTLGATDTVKVIEHWTLDTLFPPADQNAQGTASPTGPLYLSSGNLIFQQGSVILLPNRNSATINKAAAEVHFVKATANGGWTQDTTGTPASGHKIIDPDSGLIVRHRNGAATTSFIPKGVVETGTSQIPLLTSTSTQVDNPISIERPIPLKLSELNTELSSPTFELSSGNLIFQRGDELHVYDNASQSINKAVSKIYYRTSAGWIRDTTGTPAADNDEILPSEYLVIRKKISDGNTKYWLNTPTY